MALEDMGHTCNNKMAEILKKYSKRKSLSYKELAEDQMTFTIEDNIHVE